MAAKKVAFTLELQGSQKLITDLTKIELELALIGTQVLKTKKAIVEYNLATEAQRKELQKEGVDIDQLNQKFQIFSERQKVLKKDAIEANKAVTEQAKALELQAKAQEKATIAAEKAVSKRTTPALAAQGVDTTSPTLQGVKGSVQDLDNLNIKLKLVKSSLIEVQQAVFQYNNANKQQRAELKAAGVDINVLNDKLRTLSREESRLREEVRQGNVAVRQQAKEFIAVKKGIPKDSLVGLRLEYTKLRNEFDLLSKAERNSAFGKKIQADAAKTKKSIDEISFSVKDFRSNVGNYVSATKKFGAAILTSFGVLGGAQLVGAILKNVTKIIVNFEQAVADLDSILGANQVAGSLELMKIEAKELGAVTAFSATQVVKLQTELAKLGFTALDISASTQGVIDFAIATGVEVPRAAKLAGSALRAFGLDVSETNRVVSVLAVATTVSALDFSKLETSISTVAPVAAKFGFSIESTVSLLGKLADAGFDASSSGTALRNIFLKMADANGELAQTLGEPIRSIEDLAPALVRLKEGGIDLATAFEITDKRSAAAFLTIIEGSDDLLTLRDSITDVNAELKIMIDKRMATLKGRVILLQSAWEGLILSFEDGEGVFTRVSKGFIDGVTSMLNTLKLLNTEGVSFADKFQILGESIPTALFGPEGTTLERVLQEQEAIRKSLKETIALGKEIKIEELLKNVGTVFPSGATSVLIKMRDEGLAPLASNVKSLKVDTDELTDASLEYLDTINKLTAKQEELQSTLNTLKIDSPEYKVVQANLARISALIDEVRGKAAKKIAIEFQEGSIGLAKRQLADLKKELEGIPVDQSGELLQDIIEAETALFKLTKQVEDYKQALEEHDIDALSIPKQVKILSEQAELERQHNLAIAKLDIEDAELLALELQRINLESDQKILIQKARLHEEGTAAQEKIANKFQDNLETITKVKTEIEIFGLDKGVELAADQLRRDLKRAFEDEDQLQVRLDLANITEDIDKLNNELKVGIHTDQERADLLDEINDKIKIQSDLYAEVLLRIRNTKQATEFEANQEILSLVPTFDPNDIAGSLQAIEDFYNQVEIIRAQADLDDLNADLELALLKKENSEQIVAIKVAIADKEIEINRIKNEKILDDDKKAAKEREKLALTNAKAVGDAIALTGKAIGDSLFGAQEDAEEAQKAFAKSSIEILEKVLIAQASAYALAQPDSVATFGLTGAARAVIMAGLIKGVFAIVKAAIAEDGMILGESFGFGGMLRSSTPQRMINHGTILRGRSHRQGGEHMMVNGRINEAQGGEAIIKVESTRKHRGLLSAINVDGGGKSFSHDTEYWRKILLGMPKHEQGGLLASPVAIPQIARLNNQGVSLAVISPDDMDLLAEKILASQTTVLNEAVEKITEKMIVGLDETNRLQERQSEAITDSEI